jgi:hypothetical protein
VRLLLPTSTPSEFDVDTGAAVPLPGALPGDRTNWLTRIGTTLVLSSFPTCTPQACEAVADLLVYDSVDHPPRSLGKAYGFGPSRDGTAVWVIRVDGKDQCHLELQPLSGARPGSGSTADCGTVILGENPAGLVLQTTNAGLSQTVLVDPATGRTLRQFSSFGAMTPNYLLIGEGAGLSLLDARTGATRPVRRPTAIPGPGKTALSRDGRYLAVEFGDPAVGGTSNEAYDLWLLDLTKASWVHLPSMPVGIDIKQAAFDWTAAGDVVLATGVPGAGVAIWRPGQAAWTLTKAPLPALQGTAIVVV